ncbi:MAG: hypothetical protein ABSG19_00480 [Candidatus Aminicenantales bacterium]
MPAHRMNEKHRRILRTASPAVIPLTVFGVALALLSLLHTPYANWLKVEAPAYAVVGRPLDVRLTLGEVPESSLLVVNIYLLGKNHAGVGRLPAPSPPVPARSGGVYSFRIDVKEVEKLALIQLVIYLTPTGDWELRTHGASSAGIPVKAAGSPPAGPALRAYRASIILRSPHPEAVFRPGARPDGPGVPAAPRGPFRFVLFGLLGSTGLVCLARMMRGRRRPGRGAAGGRLFWLAAATVLFAAVFWEVFNLEERLSTWGRRIIVDLDVYYFRQSYQKAVIALIAAGFAGVLLLSSRAISRNRAGLYPALAGLALAGYGCLALAGALSFHYMDVVKSISLARIPLIDIVKAACAGAVFILGLIAPSGPGRR